MDSANCPHCTGELIHLADRPWVTDETALADPCTLRVECPHCEVEILIRRVVTVEYEVEPAPDDVLDTVIAEALDYWSDSGATLEDVTALAEWMMARKWAPTGKADEDILLVCAGYSDLCVERWCAAWVSMLAMDGWENNLAKLLEVEDGKAD